jgi:hypothetical protein
MFLDISSTFTTARTLPMPSPSSLPVSLRLVAGEMIRSDGHTIWNGSEWRMDVTDDAGNSVFTLRFSADNHA